MNIKMYKLINTILDSVDYDLFPEPYSKEQVKHMIRHSTYKTTFPDNLPPSNTGIKKP